MNLQLFLASAVVSALVAGVVSVLVSERKIQIENITQERAKWRAKVREKAVELHQSACAQDSSKLKQLRLEFSLNLNPFDKEDNAILDLIGKLPHSQCLEDELQEFSERLALLLKHDWERAKHEAKLWSRLSLPPTRVAYGEFKKTEADVSAPAHQAIVTTQGKPISS